MAAALEARNDEARAFASALRRFRTARRVSQLDLALSCDVSARHLSFLETGRARPSREMVLKLAAGLLLPLGARNGLMRAAGYSAAFSASPLDSAELEPFRAILAEMIARHEPNPALVCDRHWTVLDANATARALLAPMIGGSGETNLVRLMTSSPLAPAAIVNFSEVLNDLATRLRLEALEAADDPILKGLVEALDAASARHPHPDPATARRPLMPLVLHAPGQPLSFLSAIAHFGTSEDVTVRDLRLELFFPADDHTRAAMAAFVKPTPPPPRR